MKGEHGMSGIMDDWFCDVPAEVLNLLSKHGLRVTCKIGGSPPSNVETTFPEKGNSTVIKELESLGWIRRRGCLRGRKRYVTMRSPSLTKA
jgi:hypothetical protein